jgi:hypothetical protein
MRIASTVLYGREGDIALIDGLLNHIRDGRSALVISGEPGIGNRHCLMLLTTSHMTAASVYFACPV